MFDPRIDKLAKVLIRHSTKVQQGERVLVEAIDVPQEIVISLIREIRKVGGIPLVSIKNTRIQRELIADASKAGISELASCEEFCMKKVQAYIGLRGNHNIAELADISSESMQLYQKMWLKPVHYNIRVPKTKWVVLRWPHPSMAQQAKMSTEAFENFYFDVCTMDYSSMEYAALPLKKMMEQTDSVRIIGPQTELSFSIKDIPVIVCSGSHNIPDGECFTAPVRDSVNGKIKFNTASIYQGRVFREICLEMRNGKVVKATADDPQKLNEILDSDDGARFIGEFAIGFNPYIHKPMLDILFDEKIGGSFHFTPGNAYDDADNGNRSTIHWDMVQIQTEATGGGEIYFDDKLIRKDGKFVPTELQGLNPEQLRAASSLP